MHTSYSISCLSGGADSLCWEWFLANDFVRGALDDAACFGQLGADAHEVGVDIAGGLAAFIDAPVQMRALAVVLFWKGRSEGREGEDEE